MQIIQPHYHAIARTAQDYERMAMSEWLRFVNPLFGRASTVDILKHLLTTLPKSQNLNQRGLLNLVSATFAGLRLTLKKQKMLNLPKRFFVKCPNFWGNQTVWGG